MKFTDLSLHPHLQTSLQKLGFETPTAVQEKSIPIIMEGKDVMACAQTGTGKTAAFTLPALHRLLNTPRQNDKSIAPRVLILTPTRELATQVLANIKPLVAGSALQAGSIVGGVSYTPQIKMLQRRLDILVATPGRLIDHMNENRVDLSEIDVVVLDEADRMLDMGFLKPVERIMEPMPKARQALLFSATFSDEVEKLAKKFLKSPEQIRLASPEKKHDNIEQCAYFTVDKEHKMDLLKDLLSEAKIWQAIVFIRTKFASEKLANEIARWGHKSAALHGDMRQSARKRVVEQMHANKIRVLVATDVAARGLDVKELSHVINFDLPQAAEDYVHRIGRTGRAGAQGHAISFVSKDEMHLLKAIEKLLKQEIPAENEPHKNASKPAKPRSQGSRGRGKPNYSAKRTGSSDRPADKKRTFKPKSDASSDKPTDRKRTFKAKSDTGSDKPRDRKKPAFSAGKTSNSDKPTDRKRTFKPKGDAGSDKPRGRTKPAYSAKKTSSSDKPADRKRTFKPKDSAGKFKTPQSQSRKYTSRTPKSPE